MRSLGILQDEVFRTHEALREVAPTTGDGIGDADQLQGFLIQRYRGIEQRRGRTPLYLTAYTESQADREVTFQQIEIICDALLHYDISVQGGHFQPENELSTNTRGRFRKIVNHGMRGDENIKALSDIKKYVEGILFLLLRLEERYIECYRAINPSTSEDEVAAQRRRWIARIRIQYSGRTLDCPPGAAANLEEMLKSIKGVQDFLSLIVLTTGHFFKFH